MNTYYFISFGGQEGNRGVVVTKAATPVLALAQATHLGLNPGGEAAIFRVPEADAVKLGLDRLIAPAEMEQRGYLSRSKQSAAQRRNILRGATVVCQGCNDKGCDKCRN